MEGKKDCKIKILESDKILPQQGITALAKQSKKTQQLSYELEHYGCTLYFRTASVPKQENEKAEDGFKL